MQLTTKHYYDDETFEHVASKFYIDGEEVDFETYQDFVSGLSEYNKDKIDELDENPYEYDDDNADCQCQCETCNDYDNCCESGECSKEECCGECEDEVVEEFDYDELLEVYTQRIQESRGNRRLVKGILDEFADIFIEDYDEDEIEDKCDDCEESKCPGCSECIDCDEECENYISSEEIEELKLIAYFTEEVLKRDNCPQCIFNLIGDIYIKGKEIGWENHKNYIQMCNDE